MGEKKIVLDTNVLISALGWGGTPEDCLKLVLEGKVTNFISPKILDELSRVMDYPKFEFEEEEKEKFTEAILSKSILVEPSKNIGAVEEDPADNKFLERAAESEADFIVSGDPHLLKLGRFEGIEIMNPATFLEKAGQ